MSYLGHIIFSDDQGVPNTFVLSDYTTVTFSSSSGTITVDASTPGTIDLNAGDGVQLQLDVQTFLEGAMMIPGDDLNYSSYTTMRHDLNDAYRLPGQYLSGGFPICTPHGQPYSGAPWYYGGLEGDLYDSGCETVPPGGDDDAGYPATVVDWVLVSVVPEPTSCCPCDWIVRTAGLLHEDGTITYPIPPTGYVDLSKDYYVRIEHRNHLPVVSTAITPAADGTLTFDFRDTVAYADADGNTGQVEPDPGTYMQIAGNVDQVTDRNQVTTNDSDLFSSEYNGLISYNNGDVDMDGDANADDLAAIQNRYASISPICNSGSVYPAFGFDQGLQAADFTLPESPTPQEAKTYAVSQGLPPGTFMKYVSPGGKNFLYRNNSGSSATDVEENNTEESLSIFEDTDGTIRIEQFDAVAVVGAEGSEFETTYAFSGAHATPKQLRVTQLRVNGTSYNLGAGEEIVVADERYQDVNGIVPSGGQELADAVARFFKRESVVFDEVKVLITNTAYTYLNTITYKVEVQVTGLEEDIGSTSDFTMRYGYSDYNVQPVPVDTGAQWGSIITGPIVTPHGYYKYEGIVSYGGVLNSDSPIVQPIDTTTVLDYYVQRNADSTILLDASANNVSIHLPEPDEVTGKIFTVKVIDLSNAGDVDTPSGKLVYNTTIAAAGTSYTFSGNGEMVSIQSDGTNYFIISKGT